MRAIKIKMKQGCRNSNSLLEIDSIYVDAMGWVKKGGLHDHVKNHPGSVQVNIAPYPDVKPATSIYGEKYVRSEANSTTGDNLLNLPRE